MSRILQGYGAAVDDAPDPGRPQPAPKPQPTKETLVPLSTFLAVVERILMWLALGGLAWLHFSGAKTPAPGPAPTPEPTAAVTAAAKAWRAAEPGVYHAVAAKVKSGQINRIDAVGDELKTEFTPSAKGLTDALSAGLKGCADPNGVFTNALGAAALLDQAGTAMEGK
jgi:hypothetical protein